ncbi:hypothetical protein FIV34_12915 [Luteibacter pinisoli]|uniref:Uncharacterized protein n=1 Tax=Luteibacter pinisoli TaxID=2589080 RepID=A0A4Y5Z3U7_9GAMM|nr:hypothetical protein [Luteibacter pinisoli]QDE40052.1 hypothetical protein FIV34_12915 [Luteibacter pinisoli]
MANHEIRLRGWQTLQFRDAAAILTGYADVERHPQLQQLPAKVRNLRTRDLKPLLELRQAAILCYGVAQVLDVPVHLAQSEADDYDFVAGYRIDGTIHYVPLQMKELVPSHLNGQATLQAELDKLKAKYRSSRDLVVGVHINRRVELVLNELDLSDLNIGELWLFGSDRPDGSEWFAVGNLLGASPKEVRFSIP